MFDEWLATKEGKNMVIRCGDLTAIQVAFNAGVHAQKKLQTQALKENTNGSEHTSGNCSS